jgi:hypothetical protein
MAQQVLSERSMAGGLLILGSLFMVAGVLLWTGRNLWAWPAAEAANYLRWERGFIIAAIVGTLLGLVLLEGLLVAAGDSVWARLGLVTYLVGAVLGIAAEAYEIKWASFYALIVVYVVLAFLGQAAFGASLLRTGLLPGWIGWATMVWNLAWPAVLLVTTPADIYYPILHHFMPLLIGIALLSKG